MDLVPQHRALLGVDVMGSASNPGYHLNPIAKGVERLVSEALNNSGITLDDAVDWEPEGDGALLTFPGSMLGALIDAAQHLDVIASRHNRRYKPELRFRIAVTAGPVGDGVGLYAPKITVKRLLDSEEFKTRIAQCRDEVEDEGVNTALIISEQAGRDAFSGDHTSMLRREDFASLTVRNKEYSDTAWVRVPGFDARSLNAFAHATPKQSEPPAVPTVSEVAHRDQNRVQADTIHGGVSFGTSR